MQSDAHHGSTFMVNIMAIFKNDDLPSSLFGFGNVLYNKQYIITFGGSCMNDIYIFDIFNNKWYKSELKLNKKIHYSSATLCDNNIHFIGGKDCEFNTATDAFYVIDACYILHCDYEILSDSKIRC